MVPSRSQQALMRRIITALDAGYKYRPSEMLSWMLSTILTQWGLPEWYEVPQDIQPKIKEAIDAYTEAIASSEPFEDILGPVYMELSSHGHKSGLGQFFTPWSIASFMTCIVGNGDEAPTERLITACDPCSGSGVMMLAFCNQILNTRGPAALRRLSVTACDLDPICAHMSAVQLIANCSVLDVELGEVLVYQGNSLMPWETLSVLVHATAPSLVIKVPPANDAGRLSALASAGKSHPDAMVQYPLFDFDPATAEV